MKKLSAALIAASVCTCLLLSCAACGEQAPAPDGGKEEMPAVKLTETEWKKAIDDTMTAENYTLIFSADYQETTAEWTVSYDYTNRSLRVMTGGLDLEGMKGTENVLKEENGTVNIYYRDGEENWNKSAFTENFYGTTFDEIFLSLKQFDGEPYYAKAAKEQYQNAVYSQTEDTYTIIFREEVTIDLSRPGGNAKELTIAKDSVVVLSFENERISEMKISEKEAYEQNQYLMTLTWSDFGTTTISAPAVP